jgi:hypothetical protein
MKSFLDITQLLTQDLLKPVYAPPRLKSYLQKFDVRLHELVDRYEISISKMTMDCFLSPTTVMNVTGLGYE